MAVNYPTSLDSFTNRSPGDTIDDSHMDDVQDAIEALEAKVGINDSAVTSSLDYKIQNLFGTRTTTDSDSATLVEDTVYQAEAAGFLCVWCTDNSYWRAYSDGANPPTTEIGRGDGYSDSGSIKGVSDSMPIKKGDYLKVTSNGTPTIQWVPIISGDLVDQTP